MLLDTQLLAYPAVAAIGSHQKPSANRAYSSAFPLADRGRDAIFILLEGHQFSPEAQIPTELVGTRLQNGFQQVLSNLAASRRAAVTDEEGVNIFL